MSQPNVFQGARNFAVTESNINVANSINYYTSTGNRTTSDATIPVKPNSSIRFTGRTDVLAKLKEHFTAQSNDKLRRRKFFLLYGMGGIGKTQICLRFIEDMSDYFSHVFWIDASSIGAITQALKGISNLAETQYSVLDGSPQSALWWISSLTLGALAYISIGYMLKIS
ncbi:hypothetical protein K443DRAFT_675539 [Laccaria amethystina LaAM-08-1]|uniref:NB-ARC domain-containing protein n=1 Tax=Laccaria amethystina LaAM-08-1 TaxID=1095629 RepID=A0A0C9XSR1_9AGAR|nr:hypothetical protein K443DRAFT_675539 [Laccaria amethystina LaAM-08-1]